MKALDIASLQHVSGGDFDVSVDVTVLTPDTDAFINILAAFLLGQVNDASSFVDQINDAPENFSNMNVTGMIVNGFVIHPQ